MPEKKHTIIGLQSSGKTTFAAALWYLVDSGEVDTALRKGQHNGDFQYLESIAAAWASGWQVDRTSSDATHPVRINLSDANGQAIGVNFVDLSGETFEKIFATREVDEQVQELLNEVNGLMLFVTARRRKDDLTLAEMYRGLPAIAPAEGHVETEPAQPFEAAKVPHQVQLVDLLDSLSGAPIQFDPKKIVVVISAWELAPKGLSPDAWLSTKMPLLQQYLSSKEESVPFRVYGISALGAEVPKRDISLDDPNRADLLENRNRLLMSKKAVHRIIVEGHEADQHDLTHPIQWLNGPVEK